MIIMKMVTPPPELAAISALQSKLVSALKPLLPEHALLWEPEDTIPYECDGLAAYRKMPLAVALPETEAQVAQILKICSDMQIPVVPRGSGTGLSGGAMPISQGLVLSLAKLKKIVSIDPFTRTAVVQPGVRNLAISEAVAHLGCTTHPILHLKLPAPLAATSMKPLVECIA